MAFHQQALPTEAREVDGLASVFRKKIEVARALHAAPTNRICGMLHISRSSYEADKYTLKTDHFEGLQELADTNQSSDRLNIRFGYRTRTNGDLALAVFLPDLKAASPNHQNR